MPSDNADRSYLSTWLSTPSGAHHSTDNLTPEPTPTRTSDSDVSIFAPSPLVPADRATGYLKTRNLHVEAELNEGTASRGRLRRLLPLAVVPVLIALLAAGWAMLSTAGPAPAAPTTTTLPLSNGGTGRSNGAAQPQAEPSRQVPAVAGAKASRTPARRGTNTLVPESTGTPTPAATDTPAPTNTALPTDTPVPTDTPAPPTATLVPPTNTPQPFVRYVVRPGDNLGSVAARYGTTVDAIMRANALANTTIFAGQILVIPLAR